MMLRDGSPYLTEIDHHDHEALIALDADSGEGVGVAGFVRDPAEQGTVELTVDLPAEGVAPELEEWLRAAARGLVG